MTEIIFVLAVTAFVFGIFLLVFLMKGKSDKGPVKIHTCANCDCHRSGPQTRHSIGHLKERPNQSVGHD
jgi:hypothetical protein